MSSEASRTTRPGRQPNILYLHCHDAGRYVQPYGYAIRTPAIQALAEQGVLFRQAFSAAPTCSPSRASLVTGQWAHCSGMLGLAHRGFSLSDGSGLGDSTLVICTTDHGIAFPEMKSNLTDHGIGVMLIVRGPGGFSGGRVIDGMVSQIDLFPTLCELLGIDKPDWLQGRSMMPLVRGEAKEINEEVFAEVNFHAAYEPCRCVRTRRWKYIRRFDGRDKPVLSNLDDSPSKAYWVRHGWHERPVQEEMLFDLVLDPQERCNIIDRQGMEEVAKEVRGRLDNWMHKNDDPILNGPIPLPEGARTTDPDDYSPSGGWPEGLRNDE